MGAASSSKVVDSRGRALRDLRISVTDRCNFRCSYCMPREHFAKDHTFLPRAELLSFEEISRFASVVTELGVHKLRLTGGEPLLRAKLPTLVAQLASLPAVDLALTTNGSLLARDAQALSDAGLKRVTVSLDALDPAVFRRMADADYDVSDVLAGIDAAARAGLGPLKINTVVRKGVNESEVLPLARYFRGTGHVLRFIEYMDVGITNGWRLDQVVSGEQLVSMLTEELPLEPLPANYSGEVARRFRYRDGSGELGVITSVTQPFCGDCTRLRLSSDGKLYTCLFGRSFHDLRALLRSGVGDGEVKAFVEELWAARGDRYSELRSERTRALPRVEMSYIGG
ncbi:MAG TPA: GTP 3',8-cyclase MoaA [Polyangiaceae bacterium]|nr:GTP 3',8-cyclase MoaA [Polyangiaceae bacterium]